MYGCSKEHFVSHLLLWSHKILLTKTDLFMLFLCLIDFNVPWQMFEWLTFDTVINDCWLIALLCNNFRCVDRIDSAQCSKEKKNTSESEINKSTNSAEQESHWIEIDLQKSFALRLNQLLSKFSAQLYFFTSSIRSFKVSHSHQILLFVSIFIAHWHHCHRCVRIMEKVERK